MSKMTLKQVRGSLRKMEAEGQWWSPNSGMTHWTIPLKEMADAIDERIKADEAHKADALRECKYPSAQQAAKPTLGEFVRMPDAARVAIGQQVAERVDEMTVQPTKLEDGMREVVAELKVVVGGHLQDDDRMSMKTLRWMYEQLDKLTAALQENAK